MHASDALNEVVVSISIIEPPRADTARYDQLHGAGGCRMAMTVEVEPSPHGVIMRDIPAELRALRLHGTANTWTELKENGQGTLSCAPGSRRL